MEELESKEKRILVIIDTNQLGSYSGKKLSCNNYSFLETNKYLYQNIVNNFNYEKITKIHIALPEIVLGEILNQQVSCFNEDFSKLKNMFAKFSKLEGFELNCAQLEYRQYLEEKMNNYLGAYSIIKIKNPPIEILPKLIKKVLLREKPFYKKENGVDSGFKDAIIWESINEFVKENSYDKYFFLTNDLDFNDKILQEEFFKNSCANWPSWCPKWKQRPPPQGQFPRCQM
ncbi:MAG: PIN domain-containing protein, partial [Nanoarchaeota archaeon]